MTKVAVITGGAKRIGRAIAVHLHQLGFDIALHYRSSAESAQSLADELNRARQGSCEIFQADFASQEQLVALSQTLQARFEAIDLLVNNASGFEATPIENCTPAQFDAMLASNLRGPYFLIQGLLPALKNGGGSIVNIIDAHLHRPLRFYTAYNAAKAGLASLTQSLAVELAPEIRVNGISPGAILWPAEEGAYDEEMRSRTVKNTPLQRSGDTTDIARAVAFLACDAPFVTGQIILVDGGRGLVS